MGQPARQLEPIQPAKLEPIVHRDVIDDTDYFEEAMRDEGCTWEAYIAAHEAKYGPLDESKYQDSIQALEKALFE